MFQYRWWKDIELLRPIKYQIIRNPNPPAALCNLYQYRNFSSFIHSLLTFPKKATQYVLIAIWLHRTILLSNQHLHTVYLHYSSSFIVLWSIFPQNTWFNSITGLPRPVMSSCSTFPLHNFFRILLLMALLFFFFGADRPCIIMQNHKTSNNWRENKTKSSK